MDPDDVSPTRNAPAGARASTGAPQRTIDRYQVLDKIGQGGMGEVFKVYDPSLGRVVALKRVFASEDPELETARLHREAQAIAQLSHPNVIAVFDVGVAAGHLFMTMEYVEGQPLGRWLKQRKPSRDVVLRVFRDAARGLAAAHDAGLVHRDFKPSNVLVGDDGRVRVLDFGLARRKDDPTDGERSSGELRPEMLDAALTRPGAAAGTPRYMAPEQFLLREVDGRTDQFAFAVALYEALTLRRPFAGDGLVEMAKNVIAGRSRPIVDADGVPDWLARLVTRGMHRERLERWPSMHDVLAELDRDRLGMRRAALDGSSTTDLVAAFPPPEDPKTAERVRWLRERMEYATTLKLGGDFEGALALAKVVAREASDVDYAPLQAACLYGLGNLEHRTGDPASARETLYRAAEVAARAGDDWQVANVWVFLVRVLGDGLGRFDEAEAIHRVARVAVSRIGDNPSLASRLHIAHGENLRAQGRSLEAVRAFELALALDEETHGDDHGFLAIPLCRLADTSLDVQRVDVARRHVDRAVAICRARRKLGPTLADALLVAGRVAAMEGDLDAARDALDEAQRVFARYPDRRADRGEAVVELALVALTRSDFARATALAEEGLELHESGRSDAVSRAAAEIVLAATFEARGVEPARAAALRASAERACAALGDAARARCARISARAGAAMLAG